MWWFIYRVMSPNIIVALLKILNSQGQHWPRNWGKQCSDCRIWELKLNWLNSNLVSLCDCYFCCRDLTLFWSNSMHEEKRNLVMHSLVKTKESNWLWNTCIIAELLHVNVIDNHNMRLTVQRCGPANDLTSPKGLHFP